MLQYAVAEEVEPSVLVRVGLFLQVVIDPTGKAPVRGIYRGAREEDAFATAGVPWVKTAPDIDPRERT